MKPDELALEQTYFMLGYYDRALRIPFVQTYIYLGLNILGKTDADYWFFQEAGSFVSAGSAVHRTAGVDEDIISVTEDGLSNFVSWSGLIAELSENKAMQESGRSLSEKAVG